MSKGLLIVAVVTAEKEWADIWTFLLQVCSTVVYLTVLKYRLLCISRCVKSKQK